MRFEGQIAVITGAGSGIGEATAQRMAKEGARVILVGRTQEKLVQAASSIERLCERKCTDIFSADVTKEEDVKELAKFIKEKYGQIHLLINNAGGSVNSTIKETTLEQWKHVQDVNLTSVFLVTKQLIPLLTEEIGENRSIVNVASLSGHKAGAQIPHYSAAKAALINFTKAMAFELAPHGVRVNSVSPGFVETPLTQPGLENERFTKAIEKNTALKRVGKPDEIANVIAFAASEEASYMTGSDLLVDGGWLIV
ncbi:SDR family NAD(P)-dependent oxidoreductase [Priestia megaterium]|uniref:SDR family NAD(P)-dependent oxidoreductase n=1 Tax=Priestia TaxID=2800373 RepID=UPI000BED10B4|nr:MULTISPECIES: SDR family oxidoreductase [Priestia]MBU8852861.1 SDR family oxidoreductase [Bacillus sp. FJAT-26377]MDW4510140.1 SDR family oxidoreductase [Priestia megaterium]PEC44631.1 short-chain dehydrogenase [Priestia megaterium]PGA20548.1 short-chain dehydrogenase [Priestia aryabhattai]PVC66110.1 SDR family NAD(P)-dependent oxidoreductase [Priestia megaterium]